MHPVPPKQLQLSLALAIIVAVLNPPAFGDPASSTLTIEPLSGRAPVQFLFIHHSCGGQLLAEPGVESGSKCIYESHPNGGGLRARLEELGFVVNEASYGSIVGDETDINDWHKKFATRMEDILATKNQDEKHTGGATNEIVAFKSCFPNNDFIEMGQEPGDPDSPVLTVANAKAAYISLLPHFQKKSDVLFVAFTAPPLVRQNGIKDKIKRLFRGEPKHPILAREFNTWLADRKNGWLKDYPLKNVAVFDYFDILTDYGKSNYTAYPSGDGYDAHPSRDGNLRAANAFVEFLQEAWREIRPAN